MIKKRIFNIVLTGTLLIGMLSGCTAAAAESQSAESQSEIQQTTNQETTSPVSDGATAGTAARSDEDHKVLVVYYSETGNTASVAGSIADIMAGDLFELEPAEPYSSADLNWRDDNSRVSQENQNPDLRDIALVAETADNWDSYDTVFIGYPIWWGIAAWPVNGFVENNDFDGKTVIPFCTASSSAIGESGELLEELAGSGTWLAGERFRSNTTVDEIQAWIDGLGL